MAFAAARASGGEGDVGGQRRSASGLGSWHAAFAAEMAKFWDELAADRVGNGGTAGDSCDDAMGGGDAADEEGGDDEGGQDVGGDDAAAVEDAEVERVGNGGNAGDSCDEAMGGGDAADEAGAGWGQLLRTREGERSGPPARTC